MESLIKKYCSNLNSSNSNFEIFGKNKAVSAQFIFNKIPNFKNEKHVLCELPHPIKDAENMDICLIVKDIDKKNRDYETTIRKYQKLINDNQLDGIIKQIIPMKQLKLEFRPFETKRKLCSSFDLFLADKALYELLVSGSRLGKEFRKKKRMPIFVDLDDNNDLSKTINNILNSTNIYLNGKGPLIEVQAFLTTQSTEQAIENINCIKSKLIEILPGGEANIKAIHLKQTNELSMPIFYHKADPNNIEITNNVTNLNKSKFKKVKRLSKNKNKNIVKRNIE